MMRKSITLFCLIFTGVSFLLMFTPAAQAHTYSSAPAYHIWVNGEQLKSADLNNTLAHLHNTFSANIDDTMVNAAAAIQHSKMQYPSVLPKAFGVVTAPCLSGDAGMVGVTCGGGNFNRITRIYGTATPGVYNVQLAYTPVDTSFGVQVTPYGDDVCTYQTQATTDPNFKISCHSTSGDALENPAGGFTVTVWDDNN